MISPSQPPPRGRQPAGPNRRRGRGRTALGRPPRRARESERREERRAPLSLRSRGVGAAVAEGHPGRRPDASRGSRHRRTHMERCAARAPVRWQRSRRSRSARRGWGGALLALPLPWGRRGPRPREGRFSVAMGQCPPWVICYRGKAQSSVYRHHLLQQPSSGHRAWYSGTTER